MKERNPKEKNGKGCCQEFMTGKMNFQEMFEKMGNCCPDMINSIDCSEKLNQMKEMFCGAKNKNNSEFDKQDCENCK
jgi:hypothetical protein